MTLKLLRSIRELGSDRRGAIVPMAAGCMLLFALLSFGAVEFSYYTSVRNRLQNALDAAALAVARSSSTNQAELERVFLATLQVNGKIANKNKPDGTLNSSAAVRMDSHNLNVGAATVTASATVSIKPIIADLIFSQNLTITGSSLVKREASGLEVALVLDNTGSMATNNRIGITKTAATEFVNILAGVSSVTSSPNPVKIGLVPFAATVNVGSGNLNATWLDRNAQSPIHDDIFTNNRGQATTANRFSLLSAMGISWAGCVESRPYPHDVNDTAPTATTPATLFVPYFAPDEADQILNAATVNSDNRWRNVGALQSFDYPNDWLPDLNAAVFQYNGSTQLLGHPWGAYQMNWHPHAPSARDQIYTYAGTTLANGWRGVQGVVDKYNAAYVDAYTSFGTAAGAPIPGYSRSAMSAVNAAYGPNKGCSVQPLTRLTTNYTGLQTAINNMVAAGSTNIPMGLVWGWHLLSPNAPFQDGAAYTARGVTKVAVLMTDGENSLSTPPGDNALNLNGSEYSGVGYVWQNRIGTTSGDWTTRRNAMDARLTELCANMKAQKIVIYTVRVEVTSGTPDVLRNCATSPEMFFDVTSAAQLTSTFQSIAKSIQYLRIAQ